MSDCFDHEADAWDSYDWELESETHGVPRLFNPKGRPLTHRGTAQEYLTIRGWGGQYDNGPDPGYYDEWFNIKGIVRQTEKAYQLNMPEGFAMWVPMSICRKFSGKLDRVKAHGGVFRSIYNKARKEAAGSLDGLPDLGP